MKRKTIFSGVATNHIAIVVILLLFSLSILEQTASAQVISRAETLGPIENGHNYSLNFNNYDDQTEAVVNGNVIGPFSGGKSTTVDITQYLNIGTKNLIDLQLSNGFGTWSYGFVLYKDSKVIWADACGILGTTGCMGGDQTIGGVYFNELVIPAQIPLFAFVRGSDNALWYRTFDGNIWLPWLSLGGVLNSDPDPAKLSGNTYVFVQGTDHALWYREYNNDLNSWGPWTSLGGIVNGGPGIS